MPTIVAFIPARSNSKRIPGKNVKQFRGHPLIAYTIAPALSSEIFLDVIVSTDSPATREIAVAYGASGPFLRPEEISGDSSPDIEWVRHALLALRERGDLPDAFAILRPTSPFRTAQTIRRAWRQFVEDGKADSLRAIEKCSQHPAKMWRVNESRMTPVMHNPEQRATPWHSSQYVSLPEIYVQNASLEMAWTAVPLDKGTIAGDAIMPFLSEGYEGFDLNTPEDWMIAEQLVQSARVSLPELP